jgi:hypothetical protein
MSSLNSQQVPLAPDNFAYVVSIAGESEHTYLYPVCPDITCDYHEDGIAIAAVYQAVKDGLMTPNEATDFVLGELL